MNKKQFEKEYNSISKEISKLKQDKTKLCAEFCRANLEPYKNGSMIESFDGFIYLVISHNPYVDLFLNPSYSYRVEKLTKKGKPTKTKRHVLMTHDRFRGLFEPKTNSKKPNTEFNK